MPVDPFAHVAALPGVAGAVDDARTRWTGCVVTGCCAASAGEVATESALRGALPRRRWRGRTCPSRCCDSTSGAQDLAAADDGGGGRSAAGRREVGPLKATLAARADAGAGPVARPGRRRPGRRGRARPAARRPRTVAAGGRLSSLADRSRHRPRPGTRRRRSDARRVARRPVFSRTANGVGGAAHPGWCS